MCIHERSYFLHLKDNLTRSLQIQSCLSPIASILRIITVSRLRYRVSYLTVSFIFLLHKSTGRDPHYHLLFNSHIHQVSSFTIQAFLRSYTPTLPHAPSIIIPFDGLVTLDGLRTLFSHYLRPEIIFGVGGYCEDANEDFVWTRHGDRKAGKGIGGGRGKQGEVGRRK